LIAVTPGFFTLRFILLFVHFPLLLPRFDYLFRLRPLRRLAELLFTPAPLPRFRTDTIAADFASPLPLVFDISAFADVDLRLCQPPPASHAPDEARFLHAAS
jgi:hypothetical protein